MPLGYATGRRLTDPARPAGKVGRTLLSVVHTFLNKLETSPNTSAEGIFAPLDMPYKVRDSYGG